jgi:hypothetical protein
LGDRTCMWCAGLPRAGHIVQISLIIQQLELVTF